MDGTVALVTGAAHGIGYATSEELLKRGAKVCIADFDAIVGEKAASVLSNTYGQGKCIFSKCDVTSLTDMKASFAKTKSVFGQIDIVCNNAGISSEEKWERMIDINLRGVVYGSQLAIEYMSKDKGGNGGTVMNTASRAETGDPIYVTCYHKKWYYYDAQSFIAIHIPEENLSDHKNYQLETEFDVIGLRQLFAENNDEAHPVLEGNGLKFVTLCPGIAQTPLGQDIYGRMDELPSEKRDALRNYLGDESEWLSPEYLAAESMMLLGPDTANGAVLSVSSKLGTKILSFDLF